MNVCREHRFDDVKGFEMGHAPVGSPVMNAFFYLVGDTLVDTGQSNMRKAFLEIAGREKVSRLLLTHHHEDHSGNAGALRGLKKVPAYGHEITARKMMQGFRILPYQHFMWGRADRTEGLPRPGIIEGDGHRRIPIHTPGHSRDHTCFYESERGRLFSGDLFLSTRIRYFRADEVVTDTIESLKKVLSLDFDTLLCGHNPQVSNGKGLLRQKLAYLEDLCGRISDLLDRGYGKKAIMRELFPTYREVNLVRAMTFCNVSLSNAIGSIAKFRKAVRNHEER
jgi:glyoxylase-like metal-dependent hydrolase (beta-lactamase superfamily II)